MRSASAKALAHRPGMQGRAVYPRPPRAGITCPEWSSAISRVTGEDRCYFDQNTQRLVTNMAQTIEQYIAGIEDSITRDKRLVQNALDAAKAEGRTHLTEAEDARCERLMEAIEANQGRLSRAQVIKTDQDTAEDRLTETRMAPAPRKVGESRSSRYEVNVGTGKTTREVANSPEWVYRDSGKPAVLATGQAFGDHPTVREYMDRTAERDRHVIGEYGDLGMMIRSLATTGATAMIPQLWANSVIDLARNKSAILQAGPTVIPMARKVENVARLSADPVAAFRAEGATITASDPTFDSVVLTAKTVSALVTGSLEFFQDSINGEQVIVQALAAAMAAEFDKAALWGGMLTAANDEGFNLASPPYPTGILRNLLDNAAGNVLGYAVNGTAITAATPWNEVLDTIYQPKLNNFEPDFIVMNAKMAKKLAKTYTTTYEQLPMPQEMLDLRRFVSNSIPSYTRGTLANVATDIVVGKANEMLVGHRMGLEIRVLNEKYAETGTVGIVAVMRVDVNLAHPLAFAVYRALGGA